MALNRFDNKQLFGVSYNKSGHAGSKILHYRAEVCCILLAKDCLQKCTLRNCYDTSGWIWFKWFRIVCFAFCKILTLVFDNSLDYARLNKRMAKLWEKSHKLLVPLKLLLQSWTKGASRSLLAFWSKPNCPMTYMALS